MFPVVVKRTHKHEAEQAVADLLARGFEIIYPLTEHSVDGKNFTRDNYNRHIFVENTYHSCWIAKLRRRNREVQS